MAEASKKKTKAKPKTKPKAKPKAKPKRKTDALDGIRSRATKATKSLAKADRNEETKERGASSVVPLADIQARLDTDTRTLNPEHVIALAESIAALGLIEPLVLDNTNHLLAGGHRLAALKLINELPKKRMELLLSMADNVLEKFHDDFAKRLEAIDWVNEDDEPNMVPVRKIDFDASKDLQRALAIEVAENAQRRDYTSKEVISLYERLLEVGFTDRRGKPRKGEKPAKPAIAAVIGKSIKTVDRLLKKANLKEESTNKDVESMMKALGLLDTAMTRIKSCAGHFDDMDEVKKLVEKLEELSGERVIQDVRVKLSK